MELFDFAKLIGGYVQFDGSYNPANTYINARLKVGMRAVAEKVDGSLFGRTTTAMTLDAAFADLAAQLAGKRICCTLDGGELSVWHVPPDLRHTPGYQYQQQFA